MYDYTYDELRLFSSSIVSFICFRLQSDVVVGLDVKGENSLKFRHICELTESYNSIRILTLSEMLDVSFETVNRVGESRNKKSFKNLSCKV